MLLMATSQMDDDMLQRLIQAALTARRCAHAPYSHFQVGAALLCEDGEMFLGCNVENASFSLTLCAERVAAAAAVTAQKRNWTALAIASPGAVTPCGACRQFIAEFAGDLHIICVDTDSSGAEVFGLDSIGSDGIDAGTLGSGMPRHTQYTLSALLPHAFGSAALAPLQPRQSTQ